MSLLPDIERVYLLHGLTLDPAAKLADDGQRTKQRQPLRKTWRAGLVSVAGTFYSHEWLETDDGGVIDNSVFSTIEGARYHAFTARDKHIARALGLL